MRTTSAVDLGFATSVISKYHSDEVVDAVIEFSRYLAEKRDNALVTMYAHDADIGRS